MVNAGMIIYPKNPPSWCKVYVPTRLDIIYNVYIYILFQMITVGAACFHAGVVQCGSDPVFDIPALQK